MNVAVQRLKRALRRLPGVYRTYQNAAMIAEVLTDNYSEPRALFDRYHLGSMWDFSNPTERVRHAHVMEVAVRAVRADSWGDALELGCADGIFTLDLAKRCTSVLACDVSAVACDRAARRCATTSNVQVRKLDLLRDLLPGSYDIVFVMGVLAYIHGPWRLKKVAERISRSLRLGGFLVMNEMRLRRPMERSWWARALGDGGLNYLRFLHNRSGLHLVHQETTDEYVIAVYQKRLTAENKPRSLRRFVPPRTCAAYRKTRLGIQLAREIDFSSVQASLDSVRASWTILRTKHESLIEVPGLKQLYRLAQEVDRAGVAGDFVECGVYRGGSAAVLGTVLTRSRSPRRLWLFDSFQGLPPASVTDGPSARAIRGELVASEQCAREVLRRAGVSEDRFRIIAGWFHETFPRVRIDRIALLHIDADWYESIKLCLDRFFDRLEPGAIVILDDYYDWPGCKAALTDFARERSLQIKLEEKGDTPCFFRKT